MHEKISNKMSCNFTVEVRRLLKMPVDKVFGDWTNPDVRSEVLSHGRYKNCVKEVEIFEGGHERYEDRWKNRLYGTTTRRYVIIRPSKMIVSHSETTLEGDISDQHFAAQELLLFKSHGKGTEVVASSQCVSIEPTYIHSKEDQLSKFFDIFKQTVTA